MVSVETEDGECGYFSLHLCEVDLEEEVLMVQTVQDSLLHSLIMIMVVMYFFKLLMEMQLLFLNQQLHLIVISTLFRQLLLLQELRYKLLVMQQVFQDNRLLMQFSQEMLQQLLSLLLVAVMLKVQLQLRVMRIVLLLLIRLQFLLENLMHRQH